MSYKTVAALAFTSMFSVSTLLSPAHAEEQEKALNIWHYFDRVTAKPEAAVGTVPEGHGKITGRESERLLRPGLRRDHPGHAL